MAAQLVLPVMARAEVVDGGLSPVELFKQRYEPQADPAPTVHEAVGRIAAFKGEIYINGKPAELGQSIHLGDVLTVPRTGEMKVRFVDSSELTVPKGAELKIDGFLLRNTGSLGDSMAKIATDALSTTFRVADPFSHDNRCGTETACPTLRVRN